MDGFMRLWMRKGLLGLGMFAMMAAAHADEAVLLRDVQEAFEMRFAGMPVDGVRATPMEGVYEVQLGSELVYVDEQVDFVLQGNLIDARTRTDLTAARLQKLAEVPFDSLPLALAIRQVKGDGSRVMAVFEDPNCGYCKKLHAGLKQIDNVTVYSFLMPILSQDSVEKARNIWCAEDRTAAWTDWMLKGVVPPEAHCDDNPVEQVVALGRRLMVRGTPAILFADGGRVNGALSAADLERRLSGR